MTNFEVPEEFRLRMKAKMEALKNQPPVEEKKRSFDQLPWEDPLVFKGDLKTDDLHFIKFGKMGCVVRVWNEHPSYGTMVAIFSDEDEEFEKYIADLEKRTDYTDPTRSENDRILTSSAFAMSSKKEEPYKFPLADSSYTPKNMFLVADGKSASNAALREEYFIPFWIKEGLIPEGVLNYIPEKNSRSTNEI
jgi:hypothetical protein